MGDAELETWVVFVTAPEAVAPVLARAVVERGLAACVNLIPGVRSIYSWRGAVQDDAEVVMMMKTARDRFDALRAAIVSLHPYEVCEVIGLPIADGSAPYLDWIRVCTRPQPPPGETP